MSHERLTVYSAEKIGGADQNVCLTFARPRHDPKPSATPVPGAMTRSLHHTASYPHSSAGVISPSRHTTSLSPVKRETGAQRMGLTHMAVSVGSEQHVDKLTGRLRRDGYAILDGPRRTGNGYHESPFASAWSPVESRFAEQRVRYVE